jgi:hypothetical protein
MRSFLPCLLVLAVATVPTAAGAFDGNRKGFVLAMGMGVGTVSLDRTVGGEGADKTAGAFVIDGRIGRGFTDQFLLYFDEATLLSSESAVEHMEFGLGFSAYFSDEPHSLYALGLVGFTTYDSNGLPAHTGPGVSGGMGWQFSRYWSAEGTIHWGSADRDEVRSGLINLQEPGPALESRSLTLRVVLCGALY